MTQKVVDQQSKDILTPGTSIVMLIVKSQFGGWGSRSPQHLGLQ